MFANAVEKRPFEWRMADVFAVYIMFMAVAAWCFVLPLDYSKPYIGRLFGALGILAIWRYGWWFTHFIRALIYEYVAFPKMRAAANALQASGWKPERVVFMMTTYKEHPVTTQKVLISIVREARIMGVPVSLYVGTGDVFGEMSAMYRNKCAAPSDPNH